ncbi:MAG: hypothetical protein ACMXYD_04715 [Candidatus Woesearchaeota archaeon]
MQSAISIKDFVEENKLTGDLTVLLSQKSFPVRRGLEHSCFFSRLKHSYLQQAIPGREVYVQLDRVNQEFSDAVKAYAAAHEEYSFESFSSFIQERIR